MNLLTATCLLVLLTLLIFIVMTLLELVRMTKRPNCKVCGGPIQANRHDPHFSCKFCGSAHKE